MRKFNQIANSYWFEKIESSSIRSLPDRIGIVNGIFIGLEFKKDASELKPLKGRAVLQNHRLKLIRKNKGYGSFIYPGNFDKVYQDLKRISNEVR